MSKPSEPKLIKFGAHKPLIATEVELHPEKVTYNLINFEFLHTPTAEILIDEIFGDNYHILRNHMDIKEGDIILDLGANEGYFSIMLAKFFPGIKIYAFEPIEETFKTLVYNIERNGLKDSIIPNLCAVAGNERVLDFTVCKSNSGGSSSLMDTFIEGEHYKQQTKSVTLDSIFESFHIDKCKLLKIDIEGMEHEVIDNTSSLDKVEYVVGEFHTNNKIEKLGYNVKSTLQKINEKSKLFYYEYCSMAE